MPETHNNKFFGNCVFLKWHVRTSWLLWMILTICLQVLQLSIILFSIIVKLLCLQCQVGWLMFKYDPSHATWCTLLSPMLWISLIHKICSNVTHRWKWIRIFSVINIPPRWWKYDASWLILISDIITGQSLNERNRKLSSMVMVKMNWNHFWNMAVYGYLIFNLIAYNWFRDDGSRSNLLGIFKIQNILSI